MGCVAITAGENAGEKRKPSRGGLRELAARGALPGSQASGPAYHFMRTEPGDCVLVCSDLSKKSGECQPLKRVWLEGTHRLTVEKWGYASWVTASLYVT